jgi:hypothetical protein
MGVALKLVIIKEDDRIGNLLENSLNLKIADRFEILQRIVEGEDLPELPIFFKVGNDQDLATRYRHSLMVSGPIPDVHAD